MVVKSVNCYSGLAIWCKKIGATKQYGAKEATFWCRNMVQKLLVQEVEEGSQLLHLSALPSHLTTAATGTCTQLTNLQKIADLQICTKVLQIYKFANSFGRFTKC